MGDACQSVPLESTVNFTVTVTLNSCDGLTDGQLIRHIITSPSFGSFELAFRPICQCECAKQAVMNSARCNESGSLVCEACECNPGRCGSTCDVVVGNRTSLDCPRGGFNNAICSGRGRCDCVCICEQSEDDPSRFVFGDACECDNYLCDRDDQGRVCSGRGMCCDSSCLCGRSPAGNLYRGEPNGVDFCQCEPVEEACMDPVTNSICNGNGTCGCQSCICMNNMIGRFCDIPNVDTCGYMNDENCISMCRNTFQTLPLVCDICNRRRPVLFIDMDEFISSDGLVIIRNLQRIVAERLNQSAGDFTLIQSNCQFTLDGCTNEYYILGNETHLVVVVLSEQECTTSGINLLIPAWSLAPIILGCLLLIGGLIVIVIKIVFLVLDYRELQRLKEEAEGAEFKGNPLYQDPEMKYDNIAYGRE